MSANNLGDEPTVILDVYTAIDLDRTILNSTSLFYDYIIPALKRVYGYDDSIIAEVFAQEKLSRGQAFDFVAYINELAYTYHLPRISVEELATKIVDHERSGDGQIRPGFIAAILVADTLELLRLLSSRSNEDWGIMTSGGEHTQSLKLKIVQVIVAETLQVSLRGEIITAEHKAETIMTEWYDGLNEVFLIPETIAGCTSGTSRRVRLLDDKLINTTIPAEVSGLAKGRLETFLVQTAEKTKYDGMSVNQIIQKIQHAR